MKKIKLSTEHIQIGTVYYREGFINNDDYRTIWKIKGKKFYYNQSEATYNLIEDSNLYLVSLPEPDNNPRYEIGQWYKGFSFNGDWYGKISGFENKEFGDIEVSEYITNKGKHVIKKNLITYNKDCLAKLSDLSEIEPYLNNNNHMYKINDYIVCLETPNQNPNMELNTGGAGFKANTCFQINDVNNYSDHQVLFVYDHYNGIYNNSVRPATEEEIAKYKLLGAHYDVVNDSLVGRHVKALKDSIDSSEVIKDQIYKIKYEYDNEIRLDLEISPYINKKSLNFLEIMPVYYNQQKSLEGRYLKALVERPDGGNVEAGEFGLINSDKTANFPKHKSYICAPAINYFIKNTIKRFYENKYQLMPEGFKPNSIKPEDEFKQGDWIVRLTDGSSHNRVTKGKLYEIISITDSKHNVSVIDDDGKKGMFRSIYFRRATKEEIDAFTQKQNCIPKPGECVYFYEFSAGCRGVGPINQAYLVTDKKPTSGLSNNNHPNFNVINNSGVVWTVNGNYRKANDREIDIARLTLPMAKNPPEYGNTVNFTESIGIPTSIPRNWCLKVTKENINFINSVRYISVSGVTDRYYITSKLNHTNVKNSWYVTHDVKNYIEITLDQFKEHVLKPLRTEKNTNYGEAKIPENNSSLTDTSTEKGFKLVKPKPKAMSIVPVLSVDINLRTNTKPKQIKI
jgi:hypothetical protein